MKFQRFLILVFAAALTAGTCAAIPVQFTLYVAGGNQNQTVSLLIDGSSLGTAHGALATTPQNLTDSWHPIEIDYSVTSGISYLNLQAGALMPYLASYDAAGNTITGLQGTYYALDGSGHKTTQLSTDYGEGPIYYPNLGPWKTLNLPSAFEEDLTGFVYLGAGTPSLLDVPPGMQTPPPTGGSDAPEPAGWWFMTAALPLVLFSKLRLKGANARQQDPR